MQKEILDFLRSRRSCRKYKTDAVSPELIDMVVEAGRCAATGANSQLLHQIVITNPEVLASFVPFVSGCLARKGVGALPSTSYDRLTQRAIDGTLVCNYNAPVLIILCNKIAHIDNYADTCTAMENMMLMANALDLGSVWVNQPYWVNDDPAFIARMHELGMAEDEAVYAALALGYADTADGLPGRTVRPITGNPVSYIR